MIVFEIDESLHAQLAHTLSRYRGDDFAVKVRGDDFIHAAADSLSVDAHKWLFAPLDAGCLLYRDEAAARSAFTYHADYATAGTGGGLESFAFFDVSPELSRRFRALETWLMLSVIGADAFRAAIARNLDLARTLEARLCAAPDFEVLAPADLSVVCFRLRGSDDLNRHALRETLRRGRVYLTSTVVGGRLALRTCFTNHRTQEADLDVLVDELRATADAEG